MIFIRLSGLFTVHDWELNVVSRFFELLYSQKIRFGDTFKVNSYY
jgi:hypothetical protein